jgi:U3 small nucleolar RNA-associated protein 23
MRHLYAAATEPGASYLIDKAKTFERRRCNHLPEEYPEPLSTQECLASVVDPKGNKTNKHRYVVASQELEVRKQMRSIMGVPLVYINRSVMIMEPMAGATGEYREREEREKFRAGLKRGGGSRKRKRDDDGNEDGREREPEDEASKKKKKFRGGPKGPNPLAVKKPKKKAEGEGTELAPKDDSKRGVEIRSPNQETADGSEPKVKRKRKRKHKAAAEGGETGAVTEVADGDE